MNTCRTGLALLIAAAGGMLAPSPAQATPSISFSEATPVQANSTVYSYTVSNSGPLFSGGYVTVYDFGSGGTIAAVGLLGDTSLFRFSRDLTNAGPPTDPVHVDDPTLLNIRATYIGAAPLATADLGTFLVELSGSSGNNLFRSDGYDGQKDFTNGRVLGPASPIPTAVPEPSSVALAVIGLLGLGLARSRRSLG